MITTTTYSIDGYKVSGYYGLVFGEVIAGIDFVRDFKAGLTNVFGGRSKSYEEELIEARAQSLRELEQNASGMGVDAVIGIKFAYEVLGTGGNMLMVTCYGTAVKLEQA